MGSDYSPFHPSSSPAAGQTFPTCASPWRRHPPEPPRLLRPPQLTRIRLQDDRRSASLSRLWCRCRHPSALSAAVNTPCISSSLPHLFSWGTGEYERAVGRGVNEGRPFCRRTRFESLTSQRENRWLRTKKISDKLKKKFKKGRVKGGGTELQ